MGTKAQIDERIRRYIAWPPLALPVQHSEGYSLCEFTGKCNGCGKPCVEIRGEVIEWPNALQLRCAGLCKACAMVTTFEMRRGPYFLIHHSSEGWVLYTDEPSVLRRIWNWVKAITKGEQ
jgi:hypothetical protein